MNEPRQWQAKAWTPTALVAAIALVFVACFWAHGRLAESAPSVGSGGPAPKRIVTTAPSVTEVVFALGLGDRVVGVSDYCRFPPEALDRPKIGGVLNPNYERIVGLRPDAVALLESAGRDQSAFRKLRLPTIQVNHLNVEGILASFQQIGAACGVEGRAKALTEDIARRLDRVAEKTARRPRPRVLVAIDRTLGADSLRDVYIAGHDGHIDRMVELAGGQNAYTDGQARFPLVSQEGILKLDPEIVVDLAYGLAAADTDPAALRADWQCLPDVQAVRDNRVYLINDDYATVPGPRFILFVEQLARLFHPEVNWSE